MDGHSSPSLKVSKTNKQKVLIDVSCPALEMSMVGSTYVALSDMAPALTQSVHVRDPRWEISGFLILSFCQNERI